MAKSYANAVCETSTTTGLSALQLAGAKAAGFRTFRQGYPDGNAVTRYAVVNRQNTKLEIHRDCTLTYGEPDQLSRNVVISTNGDAAISWTTDDHPLTVFVPTDADVLEMAVTFGLGSARPTVLRYGPWAKENTPSSVFDTLNFYDGDTSIPYALIDKTGNKYLPMIAVAPQGRLCLASGVAVVASNVAAGTTVYYTPHIGELIPVYDSTSGRHYLRTFAELSNVLANSSTGKAGPAAAGNSKCIDLFVWDDAGTMRLTRGADWNSDTARSAATENDLERINGLWVNKNAITNGPAARAGTYVGTIRTNGSGAIDFNFGAIGAGGTAAVISVWNAYNRVDVRGLVADSTDSWTYGSGSFRAANGSSTLRASFVQGLAEDGWESRYEAAANGGGSSGIAVVAVGLDSTTSASGSTRQFVSLGNVLAFCVASRRDQALLGWHYHQALENNVTATVTFYGDNAGSTVQSGLAYSGRF
jgi:hypothetical protein